MRWRWAVFGAADAVAASALTLVAFAVAACAVSLGAAACTADPPAGLPDRGPPVQVSMPSRPGPEALPVPSPDDSHAAVPNVDPYRTVSPAQGPVRLTVRAARPHTGAPAAAYDAYLGWVGAYLAVFAQPGRDAGQLDRYSTPAVARVIRYQAGRLAVRGWAEYGTAIVVSAVPHQAGTGAVVDACLDLSGLATRDAAGRLAGREHPVRCLAKLTIAAGRWVVSAEQKTPVSRCS
jgi:hypothetical protein